MQLSTFGAYLLIAGISLIHTYSENNMKSCVIVGGGLAGLTCAREIRRFQGSNIRLIIVDGGSKFGGRMNSINGIDMGAAWSWHSDSELRAIVKDLNIELTPQLADGVALFEKAYGPLQNAGRGIGPSGEGSTRFKGGSMQIIDKLVEDSERDGVDLRLNHWVSSISQESSMTEGPVRLTLTTDSSEEVILEADAVVLAAPPRAMLNSITFTPPLDRGKAEAMARTETWMQTAGKVGFVYNDPFWKSDASNGLSGTVFSERGPMRQIWYNSPSSDGKYALCGFVFGSDLTMLEGNETDIRHSSIMEQMVRIFGEAAAHPEEVMWKSWWGVDHGPGTEGATGGVPYGDPRLCRPHGHIVFSGTETALGEHGHMNGAVVSGKRAAKEVIKMLGL